MNNQQWKESNKMQEIQYMIGAYENLIRGEITPKSVRVSCWAYYRIKGNEAGGSLHIVLDDGNYTDAAIQSCVDWALEIGDDFGFVLGKLILKLNPAQRIELATELDYVWYGK
jgi:hypothetical protein